MNNFQEDVYLIDSGTTHTIFKDKKYFSHLNMGKINVTTIFGSTNLIEGFGKIIIILPKGTKFIINNVMFSPKSRRNLISFKDIRENGYHIKTIDEMNLEYLGITKNVSGQTCVVEKFPALSSGLINNDETNHRKFKWASIKELEEKVLKRFYVDGAYLLSTPMVIRPLDVNKDLFRPQEKNEELLGPEIPYLSAIGALMYLANNTRPDIAFLVNLLARFEDCKSEDNWMFSVRKSSISSWMGTIKRGFERGSDRISGLILKSLCIGSLSGSPRNKILDPQEPFLQFWNKIFVLACIISVAIDPLFFYIPVIDSKRKCLDLDRTLKIPISILRSVTDLFYVYHIILQFRTGFIAPSSRVFGRGELIEDPYLIAKRYFSSYFFIDILAVLPLPQMVLFIVAPYMNRPISLVTKKQLVIVILVQYVPRIFRIYPLHKEVTSTTGFFTETAWAGAAFNLFLFMIASNVVGALWYLITVQRQNDCWTKICKGIKKCVLDDLCCGHQGKLNAQLLKSSCPLLKPEAIHEKDFDFGIFLDALQSRVTEKRNFWSKLSYCFWWGLRNLSSLGQDLKTSNFVWEILFAIFICIVGLILFSLLIGNMQEYLQSITVRVEGMRLRRRDAEQWMSHRMLPDNLRERIRRYEQYKWQQTRGVDEDYLISNLPKDLRRDVKRHLCWSLLKRVPMFDKMDEQLLDALCDRLKPALFTENSFIIREGDPVNEMLFLMRGTLLTMTTNGGRTGFFNSASLKAGDFCGEELLTWALDPNASLTLPASTRTVRAVIDVEAFALTADDLKFVAAQFRRLHSKQLRHTFRFYSQHWRTWAACFIQAAWRRHCRNKLEKSLREEEDRLQAALANEIATLPSLGATIYASKFAANALRALRRNHPRVSKSSTRLSPLLLQKPAEPDFSSSS
ncbi:Cyclic nucleotide-gated ion channel 1 [Capsicum annuum]|uniref:Cyclic nucleotide-gated ion channel 1 n=1 Tax=Capsicum annuum TaxID=4072 RepID=A0A2G2YYA8_CAPAN|nr:Cyclic nucleotide-gated ion channel 1 [Capsicum annuum]